MWNGGDWLRYTGGGRELREFRLRHRPSVEHTLTAELADQTIYVQMACGASFNSRCSFENGTPASCQPYDEYSDSVICLHIHDVTASPSNRNSWSGKGRLVSSSNCACTLRRRWANIRSETVSSLGCLKMAQISSRAAIRRGL